MSSPHVFEATAADFQTAVVDRSATTPILLDFWADWCGPCRTLGPILERLADEYGGGFALGKVDTERERELAAAFQVQSIPFCVLMVQRRPVDAFAGAIGEAEVRRFLKRAGIEPLAAAEPVADVDPDAPAERVRTALAAIARGDLTAVREGLTGVPEEDENHARAQRILDGLGVLEADDLGPQGPAQVALHRGRELLLAGDPDAALEHLLASVAADRAFRESAARRLAVLAFELMTLEPDGEERARAFRRRLATLLY